VTAIKHMQARIINCALTSTGGFLRTDGNREAQEMYMPYL